MKFDEQTLRHIVSHSGLGHDHSHIRNVIKEHAPHHEAEHLKNQYNKLIHGHSLQKHELEELLNKLRGYKISGIHLNTVWSNNDALFRKAKYDVKRDIQELNEDRSQEKKLEEQAKLEKVQEKEAERAALKAKMTVMPGGKAGHIPHHEGTPASHTIGKAA